MGRDAECRDETRQSPCSCRRNKSQTRADSPFFNFNPESPLMGGKQDPSGLKRERLFVCRRRSKHP